jgi:hypothetical protein
MTEPSNPTPILTKEDRAWLVRNLWDALQVPEWTKDDLIDLGKAIFAKKALKELDDKLFDRLFPLVVQIADCLGTKMASYDPATVAVLVPAATPRVIQTADILPASIPLVIRTAERLPASIPATVPAAVPAAIPANMPGAIPAKIPTSSAPIEIPDPPKS